MSEGKWFATKMAIAKALRVDRGTIDRWVQRDDFPRSTASGYPRAEVIAWVDEHNRQKMASMDGTDNKARKLRLECERLQVTIQREQEVLEQEKIKTQQARGELVPIATLRADVTDLVQMFTAGLDQMVIDFGARTRDAAQTEALRKTADGLRSKLTAQLEAMT